MARIKKLVLMPVGPCQFVAPTSNFGDFDQEQRRRQTYDNHLPQPRKAYVTILHSSEDYVCGAIPQNVVAGLQRDARETEALLPAENRHGQESYFCGDYQVVSVGKQRF